MLLTARYASTLQLQLKQPIVSISSRPVGLASLWLVGTVLYIDMVYLRQELCLSLSAARDLMLSLGLLWKSTEVTSRCLGHDAQDWPNKGDEPCTYVRPFP